MIHQISVRDVDASQWGMRFVKPHPVWNIARIPITIQRIFSPDRARPEGALPDDVLPNISAFDYVVLIIADGFGWHSFQRHQSHPFLQRIEHTGILTKLTTQFPSTTLCNISLLHTGYPVGESGLYEWFMYEPSIGHIIKPLPFSTARAAYRDALPEEFAQTVYPSGSLYEQLQQAGVVSYVYQHEAYALSAASLAMTRSATIRPYRSLAEAAVTMRDAITETPGRSYHCFYHDKIDAIGHAYGPSSHHFHAEAAHFLHTLEHTLLPELQHTGKRGLILMTADHGQIDIDPKQTIYLNRELPEIMRYLTKSHTGEILAPAGNCRDLFLHVQEEYLETCMTLLQTHLGARATVVFTEQLIREGIFGARVTSRLRERVGNIAILAQHAQTVWWEEEPDFPSMQERGYHGGLLPEEMHTYLLALPV